MKKSVLIVIMAVAATVTMSAQDALDKQERRGPSPEKRVERQVKHLDKKLNLTDEQEKILKDYYVEFDKMKQARMEQMRLQEKREREALDGKIQSILTDEQKAKYAEMKEHRKDMKKDGKRGHRHGRGHGMKRGGMPPMGGQGEEMQFDSME